MAHAWASAWSAAWLHDGCAGDAGGDWSVTPARGRPRRVMSRAGFNMAAMLATARAPGNVADPGPYP
jgi:hypothetical protein